jgi:iron(III) transport system ATP-binding protein
LIEVTALSKNYSSGRSDVAAVRSVSFTVEPGAFYTLLGPSGCGKSTTLRCVAGLEVPNDGQITIDKDIVFSSSGRRNVPVERRPIGMVFQNYAVWPHMTVFENVAYPLRVAGGHLTKQELRQRVLDTLDLVGLSALADRPSPRLSGGQQQRVALARAIVRRPSVLLLDEPLSNLDARLRDQMRGELRRLQDVLRLTTLFVTHDQTEALTLSNVVAVMKDGRIAQTGSPREIYEKPATLFVARFVGSINVIEANACSSEGDGRARVSTSLGDLIVLDTTDNGLVTAVGVRPENVVLHENDPGPRPNLFQAIVQQSVFQGDGVEITVTSDGTALRTRQHPWRRFEPGTLVWFELPVEGCIGLGGDDPGLDPATATAPTSADAHEASPLAPPL